jgi:hypothetical protein
MSHAILNSADIAHAWAIDSDLGPQLNITFIDPDSMHAEVCWIRDPQLRGFHAPRPLTSPVHAASDATYQD